MREWIKKFISSYASRIVLLISLFIIVLIGSSIPAKWGELFEEGDRRGQATPIFDDGQSKVEIEGGRLLITDKEEGRLHTIDLHETKLLPGKLLQNKGPDEPPMKGTRIVAGIIVRGEETTYIVTIKPEPLLLISYPTPAGEKPQIIIDKSQNLLYFYDKGELIKRYPVATGAKESHTPEGTFKIVTKANLEDGNPPGQLGVRWMGLGVPFEADKRGPRGDERAPQGLKYGIHGTNDPLSIGNHISGGCIRMQNEDIIELFPLVPPGTEVTIKP